MIYTNKLKRKIQDVIGKIYNTIIFFFMNKNNVLVINAWMNLYGETLKHLNFGDDLNYYLLKELTGKRIINYKNMYISNLVNYCCIGSIIDSLANHYSFIWGSGVIAETAIMKNTPKKVYAVRGALSRKYLLDHGIECPPIYGDPALLLPLVYQPPKNQKKHIIGIIPHIADLTNNKVYNLLHQEYDLKLIKLCDYKSWKNIIDEINQCDFIISSSLHGIIISDAYHIPNLWVEFSNNVVGNGFKFLDYYSSVRIKIPQVIKITETTTIEELLAYKKQWTPINIDLKKLLLSCPFNIKSQYIKLCDA